MSSIKVGVFTGAQRSGVMLRYRQRDEFPCDLIQLKANFSQIMEAYSNCRQFNCVTPIVEQAEYHMFCREKAELYLPELYNKIGVGLMAWGPLSMSLPENSERLLFSTKGSLRNKSQSYSWTEDELSKEVRNKLLPSERQK